MKSEKVIAIAEMIIAAAILVGGISWLNTIYDETKANGKVIEQYTEDLKRIDRRLSRIEGKLGIGETH